MDQSRKVKKITVDRNACTGAATCVVLAPQAFELDSEGVASVKATALSHTDEELIAAAISCPTQAIKLYDEQGNEIKVG